MTRLVICEKPSVAKDVAKALSASHTFTKVDWGFQSDEWWVTAAAGHLLSELNPEGYDPALKVWSAETLPVLPDTFRYEPRDARAAARLKQLASLCAAPQVSEVVNACDAGREGELIFKLITQHLNVTVPITRAWFSSMTPTAILGAFAALRPDREMWPLEAAARCRSEADWVVGVNATRGATVSLGGGRTLLSLGRVQTPTLALIVNRDVSITNFVPEDFFVLRGDFVIDDDGTHGARNVEAWWRSGRGDDAVDRAAQRETLDAVAAAVTSVGRGKFLDVDVKTEMVGAPKLFDLTDLQREANKKYGMTAAATLAAAQSCYEEHKVLSYPRTDSRFLPSDMAAVVSDLVERVRDADAAYASAASAVLAACDPSKLVNDAKVSDHHALVPTNADHDLSKLSADQRKVYDLVARRLLASLLPAQQLERTIAWIQVDTTPEPALFRAAGRREVAPGWRVAWPEKWAETQGVKDDDEEDDDDKALPFLALGETAAVADAEVLARATTPPTPFNEASLLAAMATAGRLVDDDDAAQAMKESGLGTPATRASIIEGLVHREYIARRGRVLFGTDKGRGVILALGDHPLTQPDLTGGWEQRLRTLERCDPADVESLHQQFRASARAFAAEITAGLLTMTPAQLNAHRRSLAACPMPECDGKIIEGRKAWGCSTYVSKEETGCGFIHWKEQSGKKRTEKQLLKFVAAVAAGKEKVIPLGPKVAIVACPRCDGGIVERSVSFGCNSWKSKTDSGCGYTLWKKNPDGSELLQDAALELVKQNKTNERERIVFAPCPICDGEILDRGVVLGCSSWKSPKQTGCGITVWKSSRKVPLSEDELRTELERQGREGPPPARTPKKRTSRKR